MLSLSGEGFWMINSSYIPSAASNPLPLPPNTHSPFQLLVLTELSHLSPNLTDRVSPGVSVWVCPCYLEMVRSTQTNLKQCGLITVKCINNPNPSTWYNIEINVSLLYRALNSWVPTRSDS